MNVLDEVRTAFLRWVHSSPIEKGTCCSGWHYEADEEGELSRPKADHHVCPRERAWRDYVRLRDGNPNYPWSGNDGS